MRSTNFILKGRTGKRSWTLNLVSRRLLEAMTEDEEEAAEADAEIVEVEVTIEVNDEVVAKDVDVEDLVESHVVEKVLKLLT